MIRRATFDDIDLLEEIIIQSCRELVCDVYAKQVAEELIAHGKLKVDRSLIEDGTLYCLIENNQIIACGGWSRTYKAFDDIENDISEEFKNIAMLRSFYIKPEFVHRGYGKKLLEYCEEEIKSEGFTKIELHSSPYAFKFYKNNGYTLVSNHTKDIKGTSFSFAYSIMYKCL